jgi:hypothetical protein
VPDTSLPGLSDGTIEAPTPGVWTAAAAQISSGGDSFPIIRVTGAVESFRVAAILIRYRVSSGPGPWNNLAPANRDATRIEIDTVTPNTAYDLEVSYISVTGKESAWTSIGAPGTGGFVASVANVITGQGALATKNQINRGDVQAGTQPANSTQTETSTGEVIINTSWSTIAQTTVSDWRGGLAEVSWIFTGFISASQIFSGPTPATTNPKNILARLLVDGTPVGPEILAGSLIVCFDGTNFPECLSSNIQAFFQESVTASSSRTFAVQLRVSRNSLGLGPSRPGRLSVRESLL